MAGDYSRKLFNRKKHYSAVLEQQGRVQLDADWNEQVDLQQYRYQTGAVDLIGKSGVPKKNGGFKISINAGKSDLFISPGRLYAGGLLFECEADGVVSYLNQPHYRDPDKSTFNVPQSPPTSPVTGGLANGNYIAYLEGWQRELSYLDDPQIQEVALGEADTTTRLQNIWQVKLLKIDLTGTLSCKSVFPEWDNLIAAPTGKLNVRTTEDNSSPKPCVLPAKGGFTSLESQLYRVQIVRGGTESTATCAWSRDNGSVETAITNISGSMLTVSDIGKDDILGFSGGQWVEIVEGEPSSAASKLFEINSVKPEINQVELKTSANAFAGKSGLKLRRWDMTGTGFDNGIALPGAWTNMENGIQFMFEPGTYKAGDYWLIPARTATGDIEWPRDSALASVAQLPKGIERYFTRLALIKVASGGVTIEDCRPMFPALTEICAEDICYSNAGCSESTATNVQQALDELCGKGGGACTYSAIPGPGWEKVFEKIQPGRDAQICFQVGDYPLQKPVLIQGKGHLKLSGAGWGTRILTEGAEAALVFDKCKSATVRDLYASTSSFVNTPAKDTKHLNGVITCIDCATVSLRDLVLECGLAVKKQVACITVRNTGEMDSSLAIQDCHLHIAHYQQGILVVNVERSVIQNNQLNTTGSLTAIRKEALLSDKKYLAAARSVFISKAATKAVTASDGMSVVTLGSPGQEISFLTTSSLKNDWNRLLAANPATNIASSNDLLKHVKKLADKVLLEKNFAETNPAFRALRRAILLQTQAIATRGITIAGTLARDVKIVGNTIDNALVGIHLGLSHHAARDVHDRAESVTIQNNKIHTLLPRDAVKLERHGIFIGNCKSLAIENNNLTVQRLEGAEKTPVTGVRVWGVLGQRMMINNNVISSKDDTPSRSYSTGILVHPIIKKTTSQQWMVMFNVVPSAGVPIVVSNGVLSSNNTS